MPPLFISFYTEGTAYEGEAMLLERSARDMGLDITIRPMPNLGKWELNCGQKPAFIKSMMAENPTRPVVWVDADARFRKRPVLFDTLDCDFAAHWRYGSELLSGTMYFGPTDGALSILNRWTAAQSLMPMKWDQQVLQGVIDAGWGERWRIERLPAEYTAIFDARMCDEPVIRHEQASRRLKHAV